MLLIVDLGNYIDIDFYAEILLIFIIVAEQCWKIF